MFMIRLREWWGVVPAVARSGGGVRGAVTAAVTAGVLVGVSACGGASAGQGGGSQTLTIATPAGLGFDLKDAQPGFFDQYLQPVYDALFRLDAKGDPKPYLATSWSYDSAQTALTVHLRQGVKFTDGTPFDAAAVKDNLEHTKSGTASTAQQLALVSGVDTTGSDTVTIHLSTPDPSLLPHLAESAGMMASPKAISAGNLKTTPVGTGPYVLNAGETTSGSTYTFDRNPKYWNKADFPFDKVVLKVLTDNTAILNGLRSGQLSAGALGSAKDGVAAQQAGLHVLNYPDGDLEALYFYDKDGTIVPALKDPRVRQAINYAIDRNALVKARTLGNGKPTEQMFSISTDNGIYDPSLDKTYPYDPAKAKQLLAEAGYPNGFTVTVPDWSAFAPEAMAPLDQDLEAVGIKVNLDTAPLTTLYSNTLQGKYAMGWQPYEDDRPWDLTQFQLKTDAPWNPFHYNDPTVNQLIDQIQHSQGNTQLGYYKQLNTYLTQQAWSAPLNAAIFTYATSKNVTASTVAYAKRPPLWTFKPTK
jgi:peptide/nickel transport system substrate-binding protein